MQFSIFSGAAVLLALTQSAVSVGTARVINKCGFDVYYASVAQGLFPPMTLLPSQGFSEVYSLPNVGVSIKLAPTADAKPTQFEFTWANGNIAYDISNIDGNPFAKWGTQIDPSIPQDASYPTCKSVVCPPGDHCDAAYNQPNDVRTMVCSEKSDLTFTLCPNSTTIAESVHLHARVHARHLLKA